MRIRDGHQKGIYGDEDALERIAAQQAIITQAEETLSALETVQEERLDPMPTQRRVDVVEALEELLVDALVEGETIEETIEIREVITGKLAKLLHRIEVDSPHVRVVAHAVP